MELTPNSPVVVFPSANGYWVVPASCPLNIPDGSIQRWDKKSLFEYLESHFPDRIAVTDQFYGEGHA